MKNNTYIRKPETIQAIRAIRTEENVKEMKEFLPGIFPWYDSYDSEFFDYYQAPGGLTVSIGKWLIKHEDGSFSAMTEEEFNKLYMRDESFHIFGDE